MSTRFIDFTETPLTEIYGLNSFNDTVMRERLPKSVYRELKRVQAGEKELTLEIAEVVANAMKDWAIERGATHYTHWFQPLTGLTAEKHDAFISPSQEGTVLMEFSGKELTQGEPDASSFPSGGLRSTFEARGYTAWDTTSPAFLKEDNTGVTLYIPTAFISYTGEALDKKVPLLRSMEAVSRQAVRVLRLLGNTAVKKVIPTVGPEQEYFLVEKELFEKRLDLRMTGRTLFGSLPPKGQEMEGHYYGTIKERVAAFMRELNCELWKLGVSAKTQHNEAAPNQFELATIYCSANVAADSNQLVMEALRKVAAHHGLVALLHEKPFRGVNGSGKHNNWSLATDDGVNLLEPGSSPHENAQFLLFLAAVIEAVDTYATLLRASAANAGNDHRLGAHEAPPAIISIFMGEQLTELLECIARGEKVRKTNGARIEVGVTSLPRLPKDLTDRNRTSPLAFTGNKFEFRMVPSSDSIAGPNVVLNTAVAEVLSRFAEIIEKADDVNEAIRKIVIETYRKHKRVIFNGNGYGKEWRAEAAKRGLPNIGSTVDAIPELAGAASVELFSRHGVLSRGELESRTTIYLDKYAKQITIEAGVMIEMANKQIFPAVNRYAKELAETINQVKAAVSGAETAAQELVLAELLAQAGGLKRKTIELEEALHDAHEITSSVYEHAKAIRERVFTKMEELRVYGDNLEKLVDKEYWPFPTYEDLLFRL